MHLAARKTGNPPRISPRQKYTGNKSISTVLTEALGPAKVRGRAQPPARLEHRSPGRAFGAGRQPPQVPLGARCQFRSVGSAHCFFLAVPFIY